MNRRRARGAHVEAWAASSRAEKVFDSTESKTVLGRFLPGGLEIICTLCDKSRSCNALRREAAVEKPMTFHCVRVYLSGSARETVRDLAGLISWLEFNRACRWGNALFVNGYLVHPSDNGLLPDWQCRAVESILLPEYTARSVDLVPEIEGPQVEIIAGHRYEYVGYPPETVRKSFRLKKI